MYSKKQVDDMLELVEKEFESAFNKSETTTEEVAEVAKVAETSELNKSEEVAEEANEVNEEKEIEELYSSMNKSEKQAHYEAAKKAFYEETVEAPMVKSEEVVEEKLNKSEFDAIVAENQELKKSAASTTELLEKLFNTKSAPAGKSITGLNVINKSEGSVEEDKDLVSKMSKSEITSKLKSLDYSELKKSDRNAINEYCLNNTSVELIKHLIKE